MKNSLELANVLEKHEESILIDWLDEQLSDRRLRKDLLKEPLLREESKLFLRHFTEAVREGKQDDLSSGTWRRVREVVEGLSKSRGELGFSPTETAAFVFSLKRPIFKRLRAELGNDPEGMF